MIKVATSSDKYYLEVLELESELTKCAARLTEEKGALVLICENEGTIVGYLASSTPVDSKSELRIGALFVSDSVDEFTRGTLAVDMVTIAINSARACGYSVVTMECRRSNKKIQKFARRLGGKNVGVRKYYYPDLEDAVVFSMSL